MNSRTVKFGDVVRNVRDTEKNPLENGITRYVGLADLDPKSIQLKRWGNLEEDETTFTRLFREGQMLFGRRRAYQRKAALAPFDGICSGDIIVMEAKPDKLLPELLPFLIHTDGFFNYAMRTSAGSLSPRTKWSHLAKYEFTLPPLDEQRRIAEILWAANEVTNKWQKVFDELKRSRVVILSNLYRRGIFAQKTVESKVGCIPESWSVLTFNDVCIDGSLNGLYKPKSKYGSGYEMVHMGDIFANDVINNGDMQRVELSDSELEKYSLEQGDLIFARRSIVLEGAGKSSIVGNIDEPIAFKSSIIRIQLQKEKINPNFLAGWFQSIDGIKMMRRITRRGAIAGIAASDLVDISIPVAPLHEQDAIAQRICELDDRISATARQKNLSENLLKSLLNELIR